MRYAILVASVLIQVCLGGIYAWSTFVPALTEDYGLSTARTQGIFGALLAAFTVTMIPAGRILRRVGPARVAAVGSVLFGSGYILASFSGGNFLLLLGSIGILAGAGTGFGYVCPLTVCAQWFPNRKGLVTGIAVAGFGGGAVVLTWFAELMFSRGFDVLTVFRWMGIVYGAVMLGSSVVLRVPTAAAGAKRLPAPRLGALLSDRAFHALVLGMFCGTFAGLMVIGNLKPIALNRGVSANLAAMAISALAIGNAVGRVSWGWATDRLAARSIPLALAWIGAALTALLAVTSGAGFVLAAAVIGFGFGSCFVVYPANVGSRYGPERVASVYPLVFLAYGLSGIVGPWTGGRLYDATGSYVPSIIIALCLVGVGILGTALLLRSPSPVGEPVTENASV